MGSSLAWVDLLTRIHTRMVSSIRVTNNWNHYHRWIVNLHMRMHWCVCMCGRCAYPCQWAHRRRNLQCYTPLPLSPPPTCTNLCNGSDSASLPVSDQLWPRHHYVASSCTGIVDKRFNRYAAVIIKGHKFPHTKKQKRCDVSLNRLGWETRRMNVSGSQDNSLPYQGAVYVGATSQWEHGAWWLAV